MEPLSTPPSGDDSRVDKMLRITKLIHTAIGFGPFLLMGIAYLVNRGRPIPPFSDILIFLPILLGIGAMSFVMKNLFISKQWRMQKGEWASDPEAYTTGKLVDWALMEGPAFFAIVLYFVEPHPLFLFVGACLLALLLWDRPSREDFDAFREARPR